MILHHPHDDLLFALATGHLSAGQAVVVRAHAERCAACTARLDTLEAVGGVMLERAAPQVLAPDALDRVLRRIAHTPQDPRHPPAITTLAPAGLRLPADAAWPASLQGCKVAAWRWMGPGRRFSRVHLQQESEGSLFLLGIEPGRSLPRHRHGQMELTQVLCGAFADDRAAFRPGDFDAAGPDVHHEPTVVPGGPCVCLTWVGGGLLFDGRLAAAMGRWVGA